MAAIRNALVIGAGIGGLTAAVALRRQGVHVDVVEIAPTMTVYGVGIIQSNNSLRALDQIGLAQPCVDAGAPFFGWQLYDEKGSIVGQVASANDAAPGYPPNNGITRPTLHRILTDTALEAGATLRFGVSASAINDGADGASVEFTDGRSGRYELVIGCDGLHSRTRKQLFADSADPEFTGQGVWRYNLPKPAGMDWVRSYDGPRCKVGFVPISSTLMYILVVAAEPGNPRFEGPQMAAEMRARLEGMTDLVAEMTPLIIDPDKVVYRPMETLLLPAPWMKGNVILIGDAAHSMTPHLGQGAAMAIEDAVLLGELMGRDDPVEGLLDEFMQRRFDRVEMVCNTSRQIGRWETDAWAGQSDPELIPGALVHHAMQSLMSPY